MIAEEEESTDTSVLPATTKSNSPSFPEQESALGPTSCTLLLPTETAAVGWTESQLFGSTEEKPDSTSEVLTTETPSSVLTHQTNFPSEKSPTSESATTPKAREINSASGFGVLPNTEDVKTLPAPEDTVVELVSISLIHGTPKPEHKFPTFGTRTSTARPSPRLSPERSLPEKLLGEPNTEPKLPTKRPKDGLPKEPTGISTVKDGSGNGYD